MKIEKSLIDSAGNEWRIAGYSNPRTANSAGATYRIIRMTDGARVRVKSNKYYCLDLPKHIFRILADAPLAYETAHGGGAATIERDHAKVGYTNNQ